MKKFTEYINESYKKPKNYTVNSFGWNVPDRTFVDDVFDYLIDILFDVNGISEKDFTKYDQTKSYVEKYFDNNPEVLQDIDRFKDRRARFCAEYLYDLHFNNDNKDKIEFNFIEK